MNFIGDRKQQQNIEQPAKLRGQYSHISHDTKKLLISFYEEGLTIYEAARRTQINVNTAKSIIKKYKRDGELLRSRRGGNKEKKLTPPVLEAIESYVKRNPSITIKEIKQKLTKEKDISISETSIRNGLKMLK